VTFRDLVVGARSQLEDAGISSETAGLDAELLARHLLQWDRATWIARQTDGADETFQKNYGVLLARRIAREPVAYIRGVQEFWGRKFTVTPGVLIPRPETELLIEVAQPILAQCPHATVVDVGTGSGCIAITLALDHPTATIYATDLSGEALVVARDNAVHLGASVDFRHGTYFADVPLPVDLVVTNPPYVALTDRPGLAPEVRDHEPAPALFGGRDGLREVRAILDRCRTALAPSGRLIMEIGYGQDDRVTAEIDKFRELELEHLRDDLQGIPRVAVVRRTTAN
jgi:release factor glutamine methyltransferase